MSKKIVIASYTPYLKDVDDAILRKYLQNEGAIADIVSWDNYDYNWKNCDAIIIRSTWDYHQTLKEYIDWLNFLKLNKIKVFNDVDIVLNNIYKDRQIKWLKQNNIPILESEIFSLNDKNFKQPEKNIKETIKKYMAQYYNNSMFVIKPAVSARTYNTYLIDPFNVNTDPDCHVREDADEAFMELLNKFTDRGIILQVYGKGIANGEYGMVFLDGKFTQAVRKKPGKLHGVKEKESKDNLPQEVFDLANNVVRLLPQDKVLIIRVDAIMDQGTAKIMELELCEPNIYIRATDGVGLNIYNPDEYLMEVEKVGCKNQKLIEFARGILRRLN